MPQDPTTNRRILLNARPSGLPVAGDFRLVHDPVPHPGPGQLLLRTLYLSLEPGLLAHLCGGPFDTAEVALGSVVAGATVSCVEVSRHGGFRAGALVVGSSGWQDYALSDGTGLRALYPDDPHPQRALGVLGLPGFAAYRGLLDIGRPVVGETIVVADASGPVGAVAGQIAKLLGCHVVGIAGGENQCRSVIDDLGFDFCVDRLAGDLPGHLAAACPDGIDVYVENLGGAVFDAVLPLLNARARVPLCGLLAATMATTAPPGPDRLGMLVGKLLRLRIRMEGVSVNDDDGSPWSAFAGAMGEWLQQRKVKACQDTVFGLENTPGAFVAMLQGRHVGQVLIQAAHE